MCTEQKVTVGEPVRDRRLRRPRTMSKIIPGTFARRVGLECENYRVRLKGILVEQDGEVRVVSVRPELIRRYAEHDHWLPVE